MVFHAMYYEIFPRVHLNYRLIFVEHPRWRAQIRRCERTAVFEVTHVLSSPVAHQSVYGVRFDMVMHVYLKQVIISHHLW